MTLHAIRCGAWLAGATLMFASAGCGSGRHAVEGKIAYKNGDGMPGGGTITFEPTTPGTRSARGTIRDDGSFTVGTTGEADGVMEGTYRVAIVPTPPRNLNKPPAGWPPIQKKYFTHDNSGLEYTVKPGRNECNFTVEK